MSKSIYLVHSDKYKEWIFDETHPTQGRRFNNARDLLLKEASKDGIEVIEILEDLELGSRSSIYHLWSRWS